MEIGLVNKGFKWLFDKTSTGKNSIANIFDKNLPLEDKTSKFISITYNKEISSIDIKKYLYQPLNEII